MKLLCLLALACAALGLAGCDPAPKDETTNANAPATNAGTATGKPAPTSAAPVEPGAR